MEIDIQIVDDEVILSLRGLVAGGAELKDTLEDLMQQGHRRFVLDLRDVAHIDSEGLGEIVRAYTTVSRHGGSLKVVNLPKCIADLLSIRKLLEPLSFRNQPSRGAEWDQDTRLRFVLWCTSLVILLMLVWHLIGRNNLP